MSYWIITVGTELVTGLTLDTNSQHISERLGKEGFFCSRQVSVPDDVAAIAEVLNEALASCDGTIITGGLGPTSDDVTREGVAEGLGLKLIFKDDLKAYLDRWYSRFESFQDIVYRQAYLPEGTVEIPPTTGSAAGFCLDAKGKVVIVLPGPPGEMSAMLESAMPFIRARWAGGESYFIRTLKTTAKSESWLETTLRDIMVREDVDVGILAKPGEISVQLRVRSDGKEAVDRIMNEVEKEIRSRLGRLVFALDDETLAEVVGRLLCSQQMTLAVAESCTGGLISKLLTDVPGSSAYVKLGVVSYSDDAKINLLRVSPHVVKGYGAVSEESALEMASGIRRISSADIGVSVTGIAGPGGQRARKPVGLVYVGLEAEDRRDAWEYNLSGPRWVVRARASQVALDAVRNYLLDRAGAL